MPKREIVPLSGPRGVAYAAIEEQQLKLSALSTTLGRNASYMQQWLRYGVPTVLPEKERRLLARELGISEMALRDPDGHEHPDDKREAIMGSVRERVMQLAESQGGGVYRPPPSLFLDSTIPVYASAQGGEGHLIVSTDEIGRAPRPDLLEGARNAYAILITGTSMKDAYEPGDRALVNPHLPPAPETDCILYTVKDGEATATIKRLVNWTDREWSLRQFNPAKRFKLDRGIWTEHHRVVGNLKRQFGGRVPFGAA